MKRTILNKSGVIACLLAAGLLGVCSTASAAWIEAGDAPDGVPAAQNTVGAGALTQIIGSTDSSGGDLIDTYAITITDVNAFYATTSSLFGDNTGTSNFDTTLWLWDTAGNILLANDDTFPSSSLQSIITDPSTYAAVTGGVVNATASGITLFADQMYLLSISGFDMSPEDVLNVDLANIGAFDELHGPNPAAGSFDHWESSGATGSYVIELGGVEFYTQVPIPNTLALLLLGLIAAIKYRCAARSQ